MSLFVEKLGRILYAVEDRFFERRVWPLFGSFLLVFFFAYGRVGNETIGLPVRLRGQCERRRRMAMAALGERAQASARGGGSAAVATPSPDTPQSHRPSESMLGV